MGGTNIKIGLVDNQAETLAFRSIATAEEPREAMQRVADTARELAVEANIEWDAVVAAGLGTPGPMCLKKGMLLNPSNLPGWHQFAIRSALSSTLNTPVSHINDANAAAFGEFWGGAARQYHSLALFTLGTGVGGGLIIDGKLVNGVNSFGSELGHVIVDSRADARLCNWGGGRGQLEAYASASAVALRAFEAVDLGEKSLLCEMADSDSLTAKHVHQAAVRGDAVALKIVDEAAFYLGIGVTCAVHAIDPGIILLGGAMNFGGRDCDVGRRFIEGVIAEFRQRTFPNVFEGTKIEFASLGGDAGYIGAAGIARQDFLGV